MNDVSRRTVALILILSFGGIVSAQPFRCDERLLLGTNNENFNQIFAIGFAPFIGPTYSSIATFVEADGFDGLGFNTVDNYIYAVQKNTHQVVRLRADGTFEPLGSVPGGGPLDVQAGDCTVEGLYVCHDNVSNQLLVFEVVGGFSLIQRIDLFWDAASENAGPVTTRLDDFAINPNNPGVAYAVQGKVAFDPELLPLATAGHLLAIDLDFNGPQLGRVTPLGSVTENVEVSRLSGLFFSEFGQLSGYGALNAGPNTLDNRLIGLNIAEPAAFPVGPGGPFAPLTDGCSCPYTLSIDYTVDPLVATCTDDEVTYELTVVNRSYLDLSGVTLTDTLDEGMLIESVEEAYPGTITAGTGPGTRFLTIENFAVPARGSVRFSIQARVVDVPVGNVNSQVHLLNLPPLFDGERVSDDPRTTLRNDPAIFAADAIFLEDITLDVTSPTDCLSDNDGRVRVSGPQLLPGVTYQVGLFDGDWAPFNREVVADTGNGFVLDSLHAGEYRLDLVLPQNVRCSYEWKDTTILIEAPNDQLRVVAKSNGPLCAGEDLTITAELSPGGEVLWRGPLYITDEPTTTWTDVDTTYAGTYELTATYGACEQIRELEVAVEPAIEAAVDGRLRYCERERLELTAAGVGDIPWVNWTGPDVAGDTARTLVVTSTTPAAAGAYQVVMDNGACRDTAAATVTILLSPTIVLPRTLEADFCDPVVLRPEITGDDQVVYAWSPADGLSCVDCPAPEVTLPLQPAYRLFVVNDSLCTDSTTIRPFFRGDDPLYVPNAFSPNGDGVNDRFQAFPSCRVATIDRMEVYDRWGQRVFDVGPLTIFSEASVFWDGTRRGHPAPAGTYVWRLAFTLINGTRRELAGEVYLIR